MYSFHFIRFIYAMWCGISYFTSPTHDHKTPNKGENFGGDFLSFLPYHCLAWVITRKEKEEKSLSFPHIASQSRNVEERNVSLACLSSLTTADWLVEER